MLLVRDESWGFQKAFGFALFWLWIISFGLGLGFDVGGEMEETDLEEGEACYYQNNNNNNDDDDDNSSLDPDVALSYIVSLLFSPAPLQKQVSIFQFCCYFTWSLHVRIVYFFRWWCWLVWYVLDQLINPSYN